MVALQIRDVSEEVRDSLAERAHARGESLQKYLHDLVEAEARRSRNAAILDQFVGRDDGDRAEHGDTVAELHAQREERERTLGAFE